MGDNDLDDYPVDFHTFSKYLIACVLHLWSSELVNYDVNDLFAFL